MPFFELNRLQKNQLFEIIRTNGLNPAKFSWGEFRRSFVTLEALLCESETAKFYFAFDFSDGEFGAVIKPVIEGCEYLQTTTWEGVLSAFARWLSIVKAEWEEPDLWDTALSQVPGKPTDEERRFTEPEIEKITLALDSVKKKLAALPGFGEARTKMLEQKIDYLVDKAKEQTVNEWRILYVGTVVTIFAEPWLKPFADQFKDAVTQLVWPLIQNLLALH
jgi:hypothetical protein